MSDVKVPRHGHEFSAAVAAQDKDNQEGQLKELFSTMTSESKRERKEVAATSGEGWSHYQSRSPMLKDPEETSVMGKTASANDSPTSSEAPEPTLTERCRNLLGES